MDPVPSFTAGNYQISGGSICFKEKSMVARRSLWWQGDHILNSFIDPVPSPTAIKTPISGGQLFQGEVYGGKEKSLVARRNPH